MIWVTPSCQSPPCECPAWYHYGIPGYSSWLTLDFSVGMFYSSVSAGLKVYCLLTWRTPEVKAFFVQRGPPWPGQARPGLGLRS